MPILDPSIQITLLNRFKNNGKGESIKNFLLSLLQSSSKNQNRNRKMFEASEKFRKNLLKYNPFFKRIFKCQFTQDDLKYDDNIYQFLIENMNFINDDIVESMGKYFVCTDKYQTNLFQPNIIEDDASSRAYTWFLSDNPIAILCIKNKIPNSSIFFQNSTRN